MLRFSESVILPWRRAQEEEELFSAELVRSDIITHLRVKLELEEFSNSLGHWMSMDPPYMSYRLWNNANSDRIFVAPLLREMQKTRLKWTDLRRLIARSAHRYHFSIISHVLAAKYSARKGRGSLCLRVCTFKVRLMIVRRADIHILWFHKQLFIFLYFL